MAKSPELLAPAGSFESVIAAVRTKADAVYLGTKSFNARRNADNFDEDGLKRAIEYCHARGVRVHITLNTLVSDDEIPKALEEIRHVCSLGADVLILQDIGLAALAKKAAPGLFRHASTQMSVQTAQGVALLKQLGFSRVVLPRELTKEEIIKIRNSTDMELEVFIHGAQCMSVSGQCYLSSMIGGRSGNRGLCAQPCRLAFSSKGGTGHDLSLKDLSLVDRLGELCRAGVDSFKIEGRMKRPEYVAAAVSSARASLDGEEADSMLEKLRAVFSRSGFTSGYFDGRRGKEMFGTRTKDDVTSATPQVLKSLARLYDKENQSVEVELLLTVCENEKPSLCARAGGMTVFVTEDTLPERAIGNPVSEESLCERLKKCGGTMFFCSKAHADIEPGLFIPAGTVNSLRRRALEELEKALSTVKANSFTSIEPETEPGDDTAFKKQSAEKAVFHIRLTSALQLPENLTNVENIIFPLDIEEKAVESVKNKGIKLSVEIPRGIFGSDAYVEKMLERAKSMGINTAYCSTLDALAIAKKHSMELYTGFSMNIFNSFSARELEHLGVKCLTLSPELTLAQISKIKTKLKKGIIAYGRLPLMLMRNCPVKNSKTCAECRGKSSLTDRMNVSFPVVCKLGCSELLNSRPIYMADRLSEIKSVDFITLYFTRESRATVDAVLDAYRKQKKVKGEITRGLYYRSVE